MDFQNDVIQRSYQIPVVVDFWAPWCGPCRVLGPVIEQIAKEQEGKWELVKINTEELQDVAMEYGIRSIPNVKLFHQGDVINEFAGALPRHQILQWLDDSIPSAEKDAWKKVQASLEEADRSEAIGILESFLEDNPQHTEARHKIARYIAFSDTATAAEYTSDIKMGDPNYDLTEDIQALLQLSQLDVQSGSLEKLASAYSLLQSGAFADGIQRIIDVVMVDKSMMDDLPRRSAIAVFRLLGNQHDVTKKYRRIFDMALY